MTNKPTPPSTERTGVPQPGQTYDRTLRTRSAAWWKPIVGIVAGTMFLFMSSIAFTLVAVAIDTHLLGVPFEDAFATMTPTLYAASLLALILLIPLTWVLVRFLHDQPWGWNGSVEARLRWGYVASVLPVFFAVFAVYMVGFNQFMPDGGEPSSNWMTFAVLAVLLMPFQAAAEEIFFRGYVQRAAGSWVGGEQASFVVGTLVSATLFAVAHFAADPWLILYYFCFGVALSVSVRLTGGLEAAIVIHVVNNVVAGVYGAMTTDMDRAFDRSVGVGGPFMLVQIAVIALCVAGFTWWARRQGVATRVRH